MRESALQQWLSNSLSMGLPQLTMISGDASFRRYFRFDYDLSTTAIAVDAPPLTEKNQQFVDLASALSRHQLPVPKILAADLKQGFMAIEDLGTTMLEDCLSLDSADKYYRQALDLIVQLQALKPSELPSLEYFDQTFIQRELDIFAEWFVAKELQLSGTEWQAAAQWQSLCEELSVAIQEQPYVAMHRDFHCRNLMLHQQQMVMIDFQDMVLGPLSYDVVSLLRDCYIAWPEEMVQHLSQSFFSRLSINQDISMAQWQRWFDLTGLQRHLKALGIFCRLAHRDGKQGYREAIPQTLDYIQRVSATYSEFSAFNQWLAPIAKGFHR